MRADREQNEKMTEEEIVVAYKNAVCYGRYSGSIYDYMRILGLKNKQQKEVTKYISGLREVRR